MKKLLLLLLPLYVSAQKMPAIHDPVAAKCGDKFYIFSTGQGINVLSSDNLTDFKREAPVFASAPRWAVEAVDGYKGHTWAPDIIHRNGLYYLYYSVSTFGKNKSCIGVATNKTLDPSSPNFLWTDHGKVIESIPNRDLWNAIDPNIIVDDSGRAWMSFGSFWDGIKMVQLSDDMLSVAKPEKWYSLSRRIKNGSINPVEAPFIFRKGKYYYLFVSFDYCCRGEKSDYKLAVGRSTDPRGPYIDKSGKDMADGGGEILLEGDKRFPGIGHNSVYTFDGKDYMFCHGYDMEDNGRSRLIIKELDWQDGWPIVK